MQRALSIIGVILIPIGLIYLVFPETRKYVPFVPKPLIIIRYQESGNSNSTKIVFGNMGNSKASYFTAEILTKQNKGHFTVKSISGDFELSTSGKGGNWTKIFARDILPQQMGVVVLDSQYGPLNLLPPNVKSDARYKFVGTIIITHGETQLVK